MNNSIHYIVPNVLYEDVNGLRPFDLNDVLFDKREIYLTSGIDSLSCEGLIKVLNYLEHDDSDEEIKIFINSPGGSVNDGLAVYDYMRAMKTPITTICTGCAASMGAIIYLAGTKRLILPNSEIMIHDPSFGNADFSGLKADEILSKASDLMKVTKSLRAIVAERSGQDIRLVTNKMKKDSYFDAASAIAFGLATEIVKEV